MRAEAGWEETFADAWGDAWHDPGFWQSLVAQDRRLFRCIAAKWKLFVMRIRMALGIDRNRLLVKDLFTDFDAVRDIIADITGRAGESADTQATSGMPLLSRSDRTRQDYEARIDALFSGQPPAARGVRVLDRSDVLDMLGLGAGPVHLVEGKVTAGRDNHALTAAHWKKVPEWLESPAAVFDSETVPGRLVFIAPETLNGATIRPIVDHRPDGVGVHLLINAYDAPGRSPMARWMRDGLLRYFDQKAIPAVADRSGLQLPGLSEVRGRREILTEKNLAGYRRGAGGGMRFSRRAATVPLPVTDPKVGPIDTLLRAAGGKVLAEKLLSPTWDRLIRAVSRVTPEAVKQGLISDYGLDEPYMDVRAGTRAAINRQLRAAKSIIDMLGGLDREQSRIAYQWMTERPDAAAERAMMAALPEESRAVMGRMKEMVHELGKAAVRAGLLSPEAFERNEYAYLHRSYRSHEAASAGSDGVRWKARAKLRAETFKGRGLRHDVDQDRLLRCADEIKAGGKFTRFERRRADGRLAGVRYVPAGKPMPAELRGWASDDVWEARWMGKPTASKVGMYRDFTKAERERMGEIEEVRWCRACGADAVFDYRHEDLYEQVRQAAPRGTRPLVGQ